MHFATPPFLQAGLRSCGEGPGASTGGRTPGWCGRSRQCSPQSSGSGHGSSGCPWGSGSFYCIWTSLLLCFAGYQWLITTKNRPENQPLSQAGEGKEKAPEIRRFQVLGGDKRDRTADLLNAIQALSQLSYTPICDWSLPDSFYIITAAAEFVKHYFCILQKKENRGEGKRKHPKSEDFRCLVEISGIEPLTS